MFLDENEQAIHHDVNTNLPKTLNGPQGNVAGKTIDSVHLVKWGLNRLKQVTSQFNYNETNLVSCMTLDDVMSVLPLFWKLCKRECKETVNMECVLLHPSSKLVSDARRNDSVSRYAENETSPACDLSKDDCQKLIECASGYGRSVRQRSVCQETTMAKARTLPSSSYETNLPLQRVMLRRNETHDNSDTPLQHTVSSTEDIDTEGQDQDSDIEYD